MKKLVTACLYKITKKWKSMVQSLEQAQLNNSTFIPGYFYPEISTFALFTEQILENKIQDTTVFVRFFMHQSLVKGQLISKANCQAVDSPKKQMNGI